MAAVVLETKLVCGDYCLPYQHSIRPMEYHIARLSAQYFHAGKQFYSFLPLTTPSRLEQAKNHTFRGILNCKNGSIG
jgi:hypothetical protein